MNSVLINIDVPDLPAAERFYSDAFDLKIGRRLGNEVTELIGFPSPIYLLKKDPESHPAPAASDVRDYSRHWTPVHLDVVVASIDKAVQKVLTAGAIQEKETRVAKWGKIALFADPFGNGFCLIEFIGRGYDEIAN